MPAVRSQSLNFISATHAQLTIVTQFNGTFVIDASLGAGNVLTLTATQDGTQVAATQITGPTQAQIESWCQTNIEPLLGCQFRVRVRSVSPLLWTLGTFNAGVAIPANWA